MAHQTRNDFDGDAFVRVLDLADDELQAVAQNVKDMAERLVPVDTGALRASLEVEKTGPAEYTVGSDLSYAAPVELGYHHHASGRFIPAQPYLRPALDAVTATE